MKFIFFLALLCFQLGYCTAQTPKLKSGDLVFIVNKGGQGKAIQLATKSKFTHVGIVFIENNKIYVYHAVEPVMRSSWEDFLAFSEDGKYYIKSLKEDNLLTEDVIQKMKKEAKKSIGKHYDSVFSWDEKEMYCSEYVWKIYKNTLNIEVGKLKQLKEFDLTHPAVKAKLNERYGKNIPLEENMISPADIYECELLK